MPERYILLNKAGDFEKGFIHRLRIAGNSLLCDGRESGVFISHLLDSREPGCVWRRVDISGNVTEILLCALESRTIYVHGEAEDAEEFLRHPGRTTEEKKAALLPYAVRYGAIQSVMCQNLAGRYLIVWAGLECQDGCAELRGVKAFLETDSFLRYLPAIYHSNDFLYRFLALYENLYLDIERQIENQPSRYDPALAEPEELRFLASCVGWPEPGLWPPERLRKALGRAEEMNALRGTREGVALAVELYTGQTPYIMEHTAWSEASLSGGARPPTLFSDCPFAFTVLHKGKCSEMEYDRIRKVVEAFSPAHTAPRVVCLTPQFLLDGHSYLDINVMLTGVVLEAFTHEEPLLSLL